MSKASQVSHRDTIKNLLSEYPQLKPIVAIAIQENDQDGSHDFSHCCRVLANALEIQLNEEGNILVLVLAALLHDTKNLPKNDPKAKSSSELSAEYAKEILQKHQFPHEVIVKVYDAILCHSYSRGEAPNTLEGKIFQDADRLDSLGAIGLARVFHTSGHMGGSIYHPEDPIGKNRILDDRLWAIDHFHKKTLKLPSMMQTSTGKKIAEEKVTIFHEYLEVLEEEVTNEIQDLLTL